MMDEWEEAKKGFSDYVMATLRDKQYLQSYKLHVYLYILYNYLECNLKPFWSCNIWQR